MATQRFSSSDHLVYVVNHQRATQSKTSGSLWKYLQKTFVECRLILWINNNNKDLIFIYNPLELMSLYVSHFLRGENRSKYKHSVKLEKNHPC